MTTDIFIPENTEPVRIQMLADVPQYSGMLARWYFHEWGRFYGQKTIGDIEDSARARAQRNRLPLALVATHRGEPVGTVSLKEQDMEGVHGYSPWLASLYVREDYRKKRVGAGLVAACLQTAGELNYDRIYLWTPSASAFFSRLGWVQVEMRMYKGESVTIMWQE